ncbi:hypothetical protein B0H14DRAFT_2797994, partial [Mycena olivaceomarginata]
LSTARDSVISTPKLLELILSHLPARDLLVTTPFVSKTWLAHTLTPALQRALFFRPDILSTPLQNPLLAEIFPPFFIPGPARREYLEIARHRARYQSHTLVQSARRVQAGGCEQAAHACQASPLRSNSSRASLTKLARM